MEYEKMQPFTTSSSVSTTSPVRGSSGIFT
jgi:hypothetical protein